MRHPISELAKEFEKRYNVKIHISQGGSRDLYEALKQSQKGDLYFPGSRSYRTNNLKEGLLLEGVLVGYNKAALMVAKGNPKQLTNNLDTLYEKGVKVVICNPNSGSIGKETKQVLDKKGIYEKVYDHSIYLTTDSRKLSEAIKKGHADIVLNWYAPAKWPNNKESVEVIEIGENYAQKKELILTLLSTSKEKELSRAFMKFASSKKGIEVFHKYGFLPDKEVENFENLTRKIPLGQ